MPDNAAITSTFSSMPSTRLANKLTARNDCPRPKTRARGSPRRRNNEAEQRERRTGRLPSRKSKAFAGERVLIASTMQMRKKAVASPPRPKALRCCVISAGRAVADQQYHWLPPDRVLAEGLDARNPLREPLQLQARLRQLLRIALLADICMLDPDKFADGD